MEEAMDIASLNIKKKLKKTHIKHKIIIPTNTQQHDDHSQTDMKNCSLCRKTINEIESGRRSPIVMSPTTSAKFERRIGVSERNPTEGKLVRETMKVAIVNKTLSNYNLGITDSNEK